MEMLSLMLGGSHAVWTQVALLLGFFWVAIAKPERIAKVARFRTAYILLGIAMIAPTAVSLGLYSTSNPFASMVPKAARSARERRPPREAISRAPWDLAGC